MEWLQKLEEIAMAVKDTVRPILGQPEAGISMGRGLGGDITKNVDKIAEDLRNELKDQQTLTAKWKRASLPPKHPPDEGFLKKLTARSEGQEEEGV